MIELTVAMLKVAIWVYVTIKLKKNAFSICNINRTKTKAHKPQFIILKLSCKRRNMRSLRFAIFMDDWCHFHGFFRLKRLKTYSGVCLCDFVTLIITKNTESRLVLRGNIYKWDTTTPLSDFFKNRTLASLLSLRGFNKWYTGTYNIYSLCQFQPFFLNCLNVVGFFSISV